MLNPCKQCSKVDVHINSDFIFCPTLGCHDNWLKHDGTLQNAVAAWNAANPINDAKMEQNAALKAVQQALAWSLMRRYAINDAIWRNDMYSLHDLKALDLLIAQGVLVETDGRITLK